MAAYGGGEDLGVVQALLENGADPNAVDRYSRTLLYRTVLNRSASDIAEAREILLEYGADPDKREAGQCEIVFCGCHGQY